MSYAFESIGLCDVRAQVHGTGVGVFATTDAEEFLFAISEQEAERLVSELLVALKRLRATAVERELVRGAREASVALKSGEDE